MQVRCQNGEEQAGDFKSVALAHDVDVGLLFLNDVDIDEETSISACSSDKLNVG